MKPADDIASEIVGRYAWTSNVKHNGRLVGQQVLVAQDICAAIERERAEIADLKSANKLLHSLIASRDHDIGQLYEALNKDRAEIERLRAVVNAARKMPRHTPAPGGAGTIHTFYLTACDVWALDAAFIALGDEQSAPETKP